MANVIQTLTQATLLPVVPRTIEFRRKLRCEATKAEGLHQLAWLLFTRDTDPRPSKSWARTQPCSIGLTRHNSQREVPDANQHHNTLVADHLQPPKARMSSSRVRQTLLVHSASCRAFFVLFSSAFSSHWLLCTLLRLSLLLSGQL